MGTSAEMSTSNSYVKYTISITQNSQNITDNYTNVIVLVRFYRTNSGYETYGTGTVYCKINGTTYSASVSSSQKITNSGITLFSKTLNIAHNSDGSKTLTCSAWISLDTPLTSNEQSYSQTLTTIARAATISDGDYFTDEGNPRVWFNNPGSFKLRFTIEPSGGGTAYASRDITSPTSPYTFSLTTTERNLLRQASTTSNTKTISFAIRTFLDGTNPTNPVYLQKTLTIVNANPTFTASQLTYQDTNATVTAITGNNQWIVQNQSSLQISFTSATAQKYATISSYQVIFNGTTTSYSSSGTKTIGEVNSSSNLTLQVKAVDSRGNSTTISKTVTCLAWQTPKISYSIARVNNFESTTNILANVTISSVNSKNSLQSLQYRAKQTSSSTWSSWTALTSGATSQASFDNTFAWNFEIRAQDKFTTMTVSYTLNKGTPIMFFDTDKISVGVNTFPNRDNFFQASNIESIGVLRTSSTNTGENYIYGSTYFSNPSGSTTTTSIYNNLSLSTAAKQYISQFIYPVGAIYMSINSTNPNSLFGGTWSLWGTGRVPVCVNTSDTDFSTVEKTGGSKYLQTHNHTVSVDYADSTTHNHTGRTAILTEGIGTGRSGNYESSGAIENAGDGSSQNLQPYITCYMWKRTA